MRVDLSNSAQIDIFEEIFVEHIYDLSAVPFEPTLVLDCGGYCGYFSVMAGGRFPRARIFCFEPHPDNLALIRKQAALAPLALDLVPMAVAAGTGRVRFEGSGMGGRIEPGALSAGDLEVEAMNFPEFLASVSAKRLLWKLDIEGAEREVFPLALKHLPRETCCFLETHHTDEVCEEMFGPYRAAGFSVSEIRRRQSAEESFDYVEWILIRS